jgi:predicted chitinase
MAMDNRTTDNVAQFYWWFGVVEDRDDPLRMGRCRVRIMGYHVDDTEMLPTGDLPWAMPIMPINSAGVGGVGTSPNGVVTGTWVIGFFADGSDAQHPMIFGTVGAVPGGLSENNCNPTSGDTTNPGGDYQSSGGSYVVPSGNAAGLESYLEQFLDQNGPRAFRNWGPVCKAAIMAQCYVESARFRTLREMGPPDYFRRYDPDRRRDAAQNGNTQIGDGAKYKGRGYVQLTWKNNYNRAGRFIGKDLVSQPELVETKEIAAQTCLWYFQRERSYLDRGNKWGDILAVTRAVNGGTNALDERNAAFQRYKQKYGA